MRISVDGSRIRNNKVAFSNLSGIVWTGPETTTTAPAVSKTPVVTRTRTRGTRLPTRYKDFV